MVSSEPPLTHSGNSTCILDFGLPMLLAPRANALLANPGTGPPGPGTRPDTMTVPLSLVCERDLDDINNMHVVQNSK